MADQAIPLSAVERQTRHRSPAYPSIGLREALQRVTRIWEADRRAGSPVDAALRHMGFNSQNGASLKVLSALRKFGLIEDNNGRVVITQRTVEILSFPPDNERHLRSLREAALFPSIYRTLAEQAVERGSIPSDITLRAELQADYRFNPAAIEDFIKDFRDTLEFASIAQIDALELALRGESMAATVEEQPPRTVGEHFTKEMRQGKNVGEALKTVGEKFGASLLSQRLVISIPRNLYVDVGVCGDELREEDLGRIQSQFNRWIEGLKEAFH